VSSVFACNAAVYEVSSQASFRHLIGFSSNARTIRAGDQAACRCLLASSVLAFFLPRRSPLTRGWGRVAREKECSGSADASSPRLVACETPLSAGVLYGPGRSPGQPSIRVAPAPDATTFYLVRSKRPGRQIKSPPIERTVPLQVTRRHNGDSTRLASPASSAAVTSLSGCSLLSRSSRTDPSYGRGRLLRMTPRR